MAKSLSFLRLRLLLPALLLCLNRYCLAHTTGLSTSELRLATNGIDVEVVMANADLMLALAHLETGHPADANQDGKLSAEELTLALGTLRKFARECLKLEFDGQSASPGQPVLELDEKDNFHIKLTYPGKRPGRLLVRANLFAHLPADHIHFAAVHEMDGKALGNKMLNPGSDTLEVVCPGPGGAAKEKPHVSSFAEFLKLGVEHIWKGYDHILFLLALMLVCGDFKTAVKIITAFTVAHSITLAVATLNLVWFSSRLVEPLIAASIIYVAIENFFRPEDPKGRWRITFLFGLIHGFGFATVLRDMKVGTSTGVAVPLVAFNLGVEAGQIVIAAVLLPIIWKLRKWDFFRTRGVLICSGIVAAAGTYWLIQRLFFV